MSLFFSKKFWIYFFLANILFVLSNIQIIVRQIYLPETWVNTLQHFSWSHDYYLYLSAVNQGANGKWLFRNNYTSEKTSPSVFYIYYIFTGKIGSLFHFSSHVSYHVFRTVFVEVFLILSYLFCVVVTNRRIGFWAALFALVGSIAPLFFFSHPIDAIGSPWWMDFETVERLNTLPHNMGGFVFLLLGLTTFFLGIRRKQTRYLIASGVSVFIAGIFFPPVAITCLIVLPLGYLFIFLRNRIILHKTELGTKILHLIIPVGSALVAYLIIRFQETQGFPWNIWTSSNVSRWNYGEPMFYRDVLFIFGILPILSVPAIIKSFKNGTEKEVFISFWALIPFILLPFATMFKIPALRLFQDANYIPWGILSTLSLFQIYEKTKKKIVFLIFIILLGVTIIPSSVYLFKYKVARLSHPTDTGFPKSVSSVLDFIQQNVPPDSIILASYQSQFIPAYTRARSYFGHLALTSDFERKDQEIMQFYTESWDENTAYDFLKKNNISYVLFNRTGMSDEILNHGAPKYSFLIPIYKNNEDGENIILFKVR